MQLQGDFKVTRRVLAENTTTHEPYRSVVLELEGPLVFVAEEGGVFRDDVDRVHMVAQITPSGSLDPKFIPIKPRTPEEKAESLKARQEREKVALERKHEMELQQEEDEREKTLDAAAKLQAETNAKNKSAEGQPSVNNAPTVSEDEIAAEREKLEAIDAESLEKKPSTILAEIIK